MIVNVLNSKGQVKKDIIGNVNTTDNTNNTITISIPVIDEEEYQPFQFSQTTGKCLTSDLYCLADEEVKLLNNKDKWIIKKYHKKGIK